MSYLSFFSGIKESQLWCFVINLPLFSLFAAFNIMVTSQQQTPHFFFYPFDWTKTETIWSPKYFLERYFFLYRSTPVDENSSYFSLCMSNESLSLWHFRMSFSLYYILTSGGYSDENLTKIFNTSVDFFFKLFFFYKIYLFFQTGMMSKFLRPYWIYFLFLFIFKYFWFWTDKKANQKEMRKKGKKT